LPELGGDLDGTLDDAKVVGIQTVPVSAITPVTDDVLSYNGAEWTPQALAPVVIPDLEGDVTGPVDDTTVEKIQGVPVDPSVPGTGEVFTFNGTLWTSSPPAAGGMADPTTTKGDLIVRSSTLPSRLGVGVNGEVLIADSAQILGVKWAVVATGQNQTPWLTDIVGAGFRLLNAGNIGIGTSTIPLTAALPLRRYLSIKGQAEAGVLELATDFADSDASVCGLVTFADALNSQTDKRVAQILVLRSGLTALNRGGAMVFQTRLDGGSGCGEKMRITADGKVGIGIQTPQTLLDVFGIVRALASGNNQGYEAYTGSTYIFSLTRQANDLSIGSIAGIGFKGGQTANPGSGYHLYVATDGKVGVGTVLPVRSLHVGSIPLGGGMAVTGPAPHYQLSNADTDPNTNTMTGMLALATGASHYSMSAGDVGLFSLGSARGNIHINANYSGGGAVRHVVLQPAGGGSVGVQTLSPVSPLQVRDLGTAGNVGEAATFNQAADSTRGVLIGRSGVSGPVELWLGVDQTNLWATIQAAHAGVGFNKPLCLNRSGGNVGIGTGAVAPGALLSLGTALLPVKVAAYESGGSNAYGMGVASGALTFGANINPASGTPQMTLSSAGNVVVTGTVTANGVLLGASSAITVQDRPSRVFETVYQNTSGKPKMVTVVVSVAAGYCEAKCDSVSGPTTVVASAGNGGGGATSNSLSFWVLPNYYYQLHNIVGCTITGWTEWY
jgi:hypothetical protein